MNETYYTPRQLHRRGRVIGLFELRNLVEAVILVLPVLYFCLVLLPLELTAKITVTLIIVVPLGGFGLIGVRDDSLTRWIAAWWRWRKKRRLMTYRGGKKLNHGFETTAVRRRGKRLPPTNPFGTASRHGFLSRTS